MADCLILGDSIAVGIAAALSALHPHGCDVRAKVGASTGSIAAMVPASSYKWVLVSAGSNDPSDPQIAARLKQLRGVIRSRQVIWIYPRALGAAWTVYRVAHQNGDRTIGLTSLGSSDGVHPSNYPDAVSLIFDTNRKRGSQRSGQDR
jgi:hypothetical protein